MGLESMISNLSKKRLELLKNLVSVGVIFTILFAALDIMFNYIRNPLNFFKSQEFIYVFLSILMLSIVWKLLSGGKLSFPNDLSKQNKPANKQYKPKGIQSYQKKEKSNNNGSWLCPKCGSFVIGDKCPKCNYER